MSNLTLVNVPSLKVIHLKQAKIQLLKVAKLNRPLYGGQERGGGCKLLPSILQMRVEFCDFAELYLFFKQITLKLGNFTIFRLSFQQCQQIFTY